MEQSEYTRNTIKNLRRSTQRMEREGSYWREEEKEQLESMFDDGIGLSDIAVCLQRTEPAVIQQIEKMDLYQRHSHPRRGKSKKKKRCNCLCEKCRVPRQDCPKNHLVEGRRGSDV